MTNVSKGFSDLTSAFSSYFNKESDTEIYIKLEGQALKDFVDGRISKASKH
jgi:hypothetical protein